MTQNKKSAITAGLLGIFLGGLGAHNWYLGEKGKGVAHLCLIGGGVLLQITSGAALLYLLPFSTFLSWDSISEILSAAAAPAMAASAIWGLVEGIVILARGDAGLARGNRAVAVKTVQRDGSASGCSDNT